MWNRAEKTWRYEFTIVQVWLTRPSSPVRFARLPRPFQRLRWKPVPLWALPFLVPRQPKLAFPFTQLVRCHYSQRPCLFLCCTWMKRKIHINRRFDAVLRKASSFIDDTPTPLVCWSASIIYVDWLCTRPYDPFTDEEVHNELYADQVDEEKKRENSIGSSFESSVFSIYFEMTLLFIFFFCWSLSSYFFFPFLGILFLLSVSILSKFYSRGDMQITSADMQRNAPFPFRFCKEEQRDDIGSTGNSSLIHSSSAKFNEWFTTLKDLQEKELTFYN